MQNNVSRSIFCNEAARWIQNTFLAAPKISPLVTKEICLSAPMFINTFHRAKDTNYSRARIYQMPQQKEKKKCFALV